MAVLKQAKTDKEIRRLGVASVRDSYIALASDYNKLIDRDVLLCPSCGEWLKATSSFYFDAKYATNRYPICKKCIVKMVEQRKNKDDTPNETKESVKKVLQMMDRVYDDNFYEDCIKGSKEGLREKNRISPFSTYITAIQSLPNWKGLTWKDSIFGDDDNENSSKDNINENSKIMKTARKRFGSNYPASDLLFLETEYEDWTTRYPCENKSQELLYKRICFKELDIEKEQQKGNTDAKVLQDLEAGLQKLMESLAIKPSQSNSNTLTEAKTFGQLIQKWEDEKPIPEPDKEFKDVDKIGLYIDVFFKGHLSKMMGLKNAFSHIYEKYIKKYTAEKPEYNQDDDSEILFDKIFGSVLDEE